MIAKLLKTAMLAGLLCMSSGQHLAAQEPATEVIAGFTWNVAEARVRPLAGKCAIVVTFQWAGGAAHLNFSVNDVAMEACSKLLVSVDGDQNDFSREDIFRTQVRFVDASGTEMFKVFPVPVRNGKCELPEPFEPGLVAPTYFGVMWGWYMAEWHADNEELDDLKIFFESVEGADLNSFSTAAGCASFLFDVEEYFPGLSRLLDNTDRVQIVARKSRSGVLGSAWRYVGNTHSLGEEKCKQI